MILPLRAKLTLLALLVGLGIAGVIFLLPGLERTATQMQARARGRGGLAGAFIHDTLGNHRRAAAGRPRVFQAGNAPAIPSHGAPAHRHVGGKATGAGSAPPRRRAHTPAGTGVGWWPLLVAVLAWPVMLLGSVASRSCSRWRRVYWRYRILPNGHDHPSAEQVVRAIGTMAATVSEPASSRVWRGQPVFGLQMDYDPDDGGGLTPWLICEQRHAHALDGALQQAYRNVRVELGSGAPLPAAGAWRPGSVVRLRKSRDPIYPLYGSPQAAGLGPPLNSVGVMLHSLGKPLAERPGSRGSVRIMILPADRTAAYLRERHRRVEKRSRLSAQLERGQWAVQSSVDAQQARQSAQMAEHAMFHVEVQVAGDDFAACKALAGALLDYPGLNTLKRRQMELRTRLYRRRWPSFAPPLVMRGSRKLMSAAELAYLVRLPSAALSVPFERAREPRLPANGGVRSAELGATLPEHATDDPAADRQQPRATGSGEERALVDGARA
jgi:hypothetical protein